MADQNKLQGKWKWFGKFRKSERESPTVVKPQSPVNIVNSSPARESSIGSSVRQYLRTMSAASASTKQNSSQPAKARETESTANGVSSTGSSSLGLALVLLGLIHFGIKQFFPELVTVHFAFSLGLFLLAGLASTGKFEKYKIAVLVPMLFFVIWYFVYSSPLNLRVFLILSIILSLSIILTTGKGFKPLAYGVWVVAFLFLDIGFLPLLIEKFHLPLTLFMENAVLFVPWWTLFGLVILPAQNSSNSTINFMINTLRILAILYVVFVLVMPAIPNVGYDKSLLPIAGDIAAAQQRLQQKIGQRENLLISNLLCLSTDISNLPECIKKRQETSEAQAFCKTQGIMEAADLKKCTDEEIARRKDAALQVSGVVDPTISEPTTAKWMIEEKYFPSLVLKKPGEVTSANYPAVLEIKNPRQQTIIVEVSCSFKTVKEEIMAEASINGEGSSITISNKNNPLTVICTAPANLNGRYTIKFQASLKNLKTPSSLKRVFLGEKTEQEKEELIQEVGRSIFPSKNDALSKAPLEFVRLNFGFGATPGNPYLAAADNIILSSSLENVGTGKLQRVIMYTIHLQEKGITFKSGDPRCLQGLESDVVLSQQSAIKNYPLPACFLELPENLRNPSLKFLPETFLAEVLYDYGISKETPIEVREVP